LSLLAAQGPPETLTVPQIIGAQTTGDLITQTRLQRVVDDAIAYLEPNEAPLITLMTAAKKKRVGKASPRVEWFERDYAARWTSVTEVSLAADTTLDLEDGTKVVAGDNLLVPAAIGVATQGEIMRVISVAGNVATVVRGQYGTAAADIADNAPIRILGPAYEEGATKPTAKVAAPAVKIQYMQIFRTVWEMSRTMRQSLVYGAPMGDWDEETKVKLKEHKLAMNSSFLFGKKSEGLTAGPTSKPLRTCDGINAFITSNVYDAGGSLTYKKLQTFGKTAFRYGSREKIFVAAPTISNAINYFGYGKLQIQPVETKLGLNITRVDMGYGTFLMVNDVMLEDPSGSTAGFGAWGFVIDPANVEYNFLEGNGENSDTKMTVVGPENQSLTDGYAAEYLTEACPRWKLEQTHAKIYNAGDYA
jgi:hypothetical protein